MAVHLNARLNTRYIPFLFSFAFLLATLTTTLVRAEETPEDLSLDDAAGAHEIMQQDLRDLTSHADPSRMDRKPGFSRILYAEENKGPPSETGTSQATFRDETDQLSVQPPEAIPQN